MSTFFDQSMSDDLDKLILSNPRAALPRLRDLADAYGDQSFFKQNYGSRLMDIGRDLRDSGLVQEGILETEKFLEQATDAVRDQILINLASAHRNLYVLSAVNKPLFDGIDSDELSTAKALFNELKLREVTFDAATHCRYFVEFGNCLSEMGRFYEATRLYEHALELEPNDSVATANLALSFREIALIADDREVLSEASGVFGKALATNRLNSAGGEGTAERLRELKRELDAVLVQTPPRSAVITVDPKSYQGFCKRTQLFLNFCFHSENCSHNPADTLGFAVAEIADENQFVKLVRTIDEMKQQFAVARLLVYEGLHHPYDAEKVDDLTFYLDLGDDSVYGVRSGKVKTAYQTIFNLLDKIAFFLNDYLQLGIPDREIGFRSIWKDNHKHVRADFFRYSSKYLRALYEVSKELSSHFGVFTDIRNLLTHRYFVLHKKKGNWRSNADGDEYHAGYREFLKLTIQLLGLAKSAIVYLTAFVRSNEAKNLGKKGHYLKAAKHSGKDAGPSDSEL